MVCESRSYGVPDASDTTFQLLNTEKERDKHIIIRSFELPSTVSDHLFIPKLFFASRIISSKRRYGP